MVKWNYCRLDFTLLLYYHKFTDTIGKDGSYENYRQMA